MRIDTLDLRAFGPFTAKPLDFSRGTHGLHVVFGQNEAGKSSALRALGAALFGIHGRTKDDFVHEYSALRLAMSLRNAKDERISFVRRKDSTPIPTRRSSCESESARMPANLRSPRQVRKLRTC